MIINPQKKGKTKMKKLMFGLLAASLLTCWSVKAQDAVAEEAVAPEAAVEAPAELESDDSCSFLPHVYLDMAIQNRYMADGEIVNPHTMLMYTAGLAFDCGLYADIWIAQDVNRYNEGAKIGKWDPEEIDFTVGYGNTIEDVKGIKSLSYDINWSYWRYPHRSHFYAVGETQKRISLDLTTGLFLNPGINVKWDYENSEIQIVPHISYAYDINESLSASAKLEAFWFNRNWRSGRWVKHMQDCDGVYGKPKDVYGIRRDSGFATIVLSADLTYKINDNFSCGPFAKLSWDVNKITREKWDNSDNHKSGMNNLVGFRVSAFF